MASFYMIFSDEDDEEFGDKNNPMAANDDDDLDAQKNNKHYGGEDGDEERSSATDSENSKVSWEVLLAKLVTAYKVINNQNTVIGKLGFAILISDKSQSLKIILYKSKIDLLSSLVLRSSNKIYVKGNFIQYLDAHNNFWSVLFENPNDRDEAIRLLEERCEIERDEMEVSIKSNTNDSTVVVGSSKDDESESHENAKNDDVAATEATCDKAVETDPEDKQNKQMKANILTRMAKMGKRLVPSSNKASGSDISDSSDPESSPKRQSRKPNANSSPILQVAKLQPAPQAHSIAQTVEFKTNSHLGNSIISAASSDTSLNLMMMQNTEIRFNLSKLDSKLDKLCDKLEVLSTASSFSGSSHNDRNNNDSIREEDIVRLEEKLIATKRENLSLKSIIRDLEDKLKTITSNIHSVDEINELKVQIKALQQENKNISLDLADRNDRIQLLETKLKHSIEMFEEREIEMKTKEADLGELRSQLNISKRYGQDLQATLDAIKKQRDNVLTKEIQTDHVPVSKALDPNVNVPSEVVIKEIMNSLYFRLCEKISNINELKHSEVLKIIGQTIKHETSECLRKNTS
ncbi:putative leucine-rich repeat-containing protein DDB_G0290503 isoform X2 [Chironomus tepperi]|uniref:putative leucine-rich repeat-containing protein DDB_G0290503 isoform X2 n=1 Tax=Chironomus tepperi TaxID=113505 RepID=UPI00391FB295